MNTDMERDRLNSVTQAQKTNRLVKYVLLLKIYRWTEIPKQKINDHLRLNSVQDCQHREKKAQWYESGHYMEQTIYLTCDKWSYATQSGPWLSSCCESVAVSFTSNHIFEGEGTDCAETVFVNILTRVDFSFSEADHGRLSTLFR